MKYTEITSPELTELDERAKLRKDREDSIRAEIGERETRRNDANIIKAKIAAAYLKGYENMLKLTPFITLKVNQSQTLTSNCNHWRMKQNKTLSYAGNCTKWPRKERMRLKQSNLTK